MRCGGCHHTFSNVGLVRSHQSRNGNGRVDGQSGGMPAYSRGDVHDACVRASVEQVRVTAAHGAQVQRTVVTVLFPGLPQSPSRPISPDALDQEFQDEQAHKAAGRRLRMARSTRPLFAGAAPATCKGARGGHAVQALGAESRAAASREHVTWTEANFLALRAKHRWSAQQTADVLRFVQHPQMSPNDLRYGTGISYDRLVGPEGGPTALRHASLHRPAVDGGNMCDVWFRTAESVVVDMLQDPVLAPHIRYGFAPTYDPVTGERVYTGVHDSGWLEAQYEQYPDDEDITIIPVLVCSDATCVTKKRAAHPVYATCALLSTAVRRRDYAWRLLTCVPQYKSEEMRMDAAGPPTGPLVLRRRKAALLQHTVALTMGGLPGGRVRNIACGDGHTRRCVLCLCAFLTDREEQEVRQCCVCVLQYAVL